MFIVLLYAEIYRFGADPNRIRIGQFFQSPPVRFPCIVLSSACCHVPSPLLYALEFAVAACFRPDDRAALPVLQPLEDLLASMHRNRLFFHEALDSSAKLQLWEDRLYFLVNRLTT